VTFLKANAFILICIGGVVALGGTFIALGRSNGGEARAFAEQRTTLSQDMDNLSGSR